MLSGRALDINAPDKSGDISKYEQSQMTMDYTMAIVNATVSLQQQRKIV